jgi:hypothetical protein
MHEVDLGLTEYTFASNNDNTQNRESKRENTIGIEYVVSILSIAGISQKTVFRFR